MHVDQPQGGVVLAVGQLYEELSLVDPVGTGLHGALRRDQQRRRLRTTPVCFWPGQLILSEV